MECKYNDVYTREIDLTKKPEKSLLKTSNQEKKPKKHNKVVWDTKNLEENEEYIRQHPPTMRIEEPKTPYDPYEQGDDTYLEKVRQMFNVKATDDVLNDVTTELIKHFGEKKNEEDDDDFVDIEVMENGEIIKKKVSKKHKDNIEFLKKRKVAYGNEYVTAKKMMEKEGEENEEKKDKKELTEEELKEIELDDQTVKNTIINKFSHIIFKKQKEEELRKLNEKNKEKEKNNDENKKEENKEEEIKNEENKDEKKEEKKDENKNENKNENIEENNKTHKKKKERKKITFNEKTEEIPNYQFPGEA